MQRHGLSGGLCWPWTLGSSENGMTFQSCPEQGEKAAVYRPVGHPLRLLPRKEVDWGGAVLGTANPSGADSISLLQGIQAANLSIPHTPLCLSQVHFMPASTAQGFTSMDLQNKNN